MDKNGQWARQMSRDRRSQARRERLHATKEYLKQGLDRNEIAYKLGVSGNTVRQYIKEIGHVAEEEQRFESLKKKLSELQKKSEKLGNNLKSVEDIEKFIDIGLNKLDVMTKLYKSAKRLGYKIQDLKKGISNIIGSFYNSLYSGVILSLRATFNEKQNRASIPMEEGEYFNKYMRKWLKKAERGQILEEDYEEFVQYVKEHDGKDKIENFEKVLEKIEQEYKLKKHINTFDSKVDQYLSRIDLSREDIPTKSKSKNRLIGSLIINLLLPGLGTLISGDEDKKKNGIIQLVVFLVGTSIFTFASIIAWVWALYDSIVLLKNY